MRSATAALMRQAHATDGVIVCSMAPHDGAPVAYEPRHTRDPWPWVLANSKAPYRYSGRECHVIKRED